MIDLQPIQTAIYQALTASPATYPVYDAVPKTATYPRIVIGEFAGQPDEDLAQASVDLSVTLHIWSRQSGKQQTHAMMEFIRERLDGQDIGGGAWACSEDFAEVMEDRASTADARLYHGVSRYRVRAN